MMKKKLAALALTLAVLTVPAAAFSDVDAGLYYAAPIAWAVERGITTGTTETTFSPDAFCTRGQIITFLWRAAGSPEPERTESPFADVTSDMNPDFYRAILWACDQGVIGPEDLSAGSFSPNSPCTRAATMGFLWRYAGSPAASAPGAFTDVDPEADYAKAVAWAVETGITAGTAETTFSPLAFCSRGQIAAFLYRCMNETPAEDPAEEPAGPSQTPSAQPEVRPLRTCTGTGKAYSLGLDGSDFTSDNVYEAEVRVDIYSPYDAVFTVTAPFPLFQACSYSVWFDDPQNPGEGYMFTCLRWDEAFADILPWEGEHYEFRFTDTTGTNRKGTTFISRHLEDDRMGGSVSWQVTLVSGGGFNYHLLEGYELSCVVSSNL